MRCATIDKDKYIPPQFKRRSICGRLIMEKLIADIAMLRTAANTSTIQVYQAGARISTRTQCIYTCVRPHVGSHCPSFLLRSRFEDEARLAGEAPKKLAMRSDIMRIK